MQTPTSWAISPWRKQAYAFLLPRWLAVLIESKAWQGNNIIPILTNKMHHYFWWPPVTKDTMLSMPGDQIPVECPQEQQHPKHNNSVLIRKHRQLWVTGDIWYTNPITVSGSAESMHFLTVHVICYQLLIVVINKVNPIAIWMNGDNNVVDMDPALLSSKQLQEADTMLEDPFSCTIVLKNPNGNSTMVKIFPFLVSTHAIQVPLGLTKKQSTSAMITGLANGLAHLPLPTHPSY